MNNKVRNFIILSSILSLAFASCSTSKSTVDNNVEVKTDSLKNEIDSVSYALGVNLAMNLKSQGLENVQLDAFNRGFKEQRGDSAIMEGRSSMMLIQNYIQRKQQEEANANKMKGQTFLKENKQKEGVKTTASGLQYKVIKEGTGASPTAASKVKCHYEGKLINGDVFDSSYERGNPATFPLSGVIPGWTEALQLMKEGGVSMLYLPSDLAYGERGSPPKIGPGETLIFKVELIEVIDNPEE